MIPSKLSLYTANGGNAVLAEEITCPASVPKNSDAYDVVPSYIFLASPKLKIETASPTVSLVEKEFSKYLIKYYYYNINNRHIDYHIIKI
jgi:hypothetical protein